MENNKLLIGVQFTELGPDSKYKHYNLELYVLRDLQLIQLLEGVKYGLRRLAEQSSAYQEIYQRCRSIYAACIAKTQTEPGGRQYLTHVTFTSYHSTRAEHWVKGKERPLFYVDELTKPICDLGFITSTRIIFDLTGSFVPQGMLDTTNVIEAFNPRFQNRISFPEYNISSRQLSRLDDTPVEILSPTEHPKKPKSNLLATLLPSLLTMGVLMLVRGVLMSNSSSSGLAMIALSGAMGITALITTALNFRRQKKEFAADLKAWREQYQNYVDGLIARIRQRQAEDTRALGEQYPDVLTLIEHDDKGIYGLSGSIYSRAPQDEDFLTFRIGLSDRVENPFPIQGSAKEEIYSDAFFRVERDPAGADHIRISLAGEPDASAQGNKNLCDLPTEISEAYKYLPSAPLLYSLKRKGALGVVDRDIASGVAPSHYFLSRMILELCYYHSPENLQFIMFFPPQKTWTGIETTINRYKFMPHFRGLFSDKSQFVFDAQSAGLVMSSLLTLMNSRKAAAEQEAAPTPHIVMVIYEEYGLKEHAFAEFLPEPPEGEEAPDNLGLSFVFAVPFQEYLPAYCDDTVFFRSQGFSLVPRSDANAGQRFWYPNINSPAALQEQFLSFTQKSARALRFFSSVYYAQIAQNGKVPSTVSSFDLLNPAGGDLGRIVMDNWGLEGKRSIPSVTESLRIPLGKTENGIAWLDLHEKGDGPHMLVAGTTGSGKSETIITLLLGLCMYYRPDELNLLLVDMKGGGFTKRLGHLPHVVGTVTDVDGDENGTGAEYMLRRFLNAMAAEIKRRKLLLNRLHVDSLDAYISACEDIDAFLEQKHITGAEAEQIRQTARTNRLSHLILVVDEFTELKRFSNENSDIDFMGEITTIARVGRSLGFHIILISQNIEGAITEDIRVNSRARLCLKVATKQASKDMIGTELAASPYMPGNGRAYLLVGTGSKFEYFQSGYSGCETTVDVPVELTLASKSGAYTTFYRSNKDNRKLLAQRLELKKQGKLHTQLEAITAAICRVYQAQADRLCAPHVVFRAPLPTHIMLDENHNVVDLGKQREEASA